MNMITLSLAMLWLSLNTVLSAPFSMSFVSNRRLLWGGEFRTCFTTSIESKQSKQLRKIMRSPSEIRSSMERAAEKCSNYLSNPAVTPTALAHSIWKSVVNPFDTCIDATCGNGKDSMALLSLLFSQKDSRLNEIVKDGNDIESEELPQLICIDIQEKACLNTERALRSTLENENIFSKCISVINSSHAPLHHPRSSRSVGLICYNLGYLPGNIDDMDKIMTQMDTTIYSITDAALMLRVGGLLSIMTYPGTNLLEAVAVQYFAEGLAMFSSTNKNGWREFVNKIPADYFLVDTIYGSERIHTEGNEAMYSVRDRVQSGLNRVHSVGKEGQTWRVSEHKSLGRASSPILITATRIK